MKSFTARVRDAMARDTERTPETTGARRAELSGLALSCGSIALSGRGTVRLAMRTEHAGIGRRIVRLLRKEFSVIPGLRTLSASRLGGRTTFEIYLEGQDAARVMNACGLSPLDMSIPKHCLKTRRSRDAFLRGVFLGCATLTDPSHGYALEFLLANEPFAQALARFLHTHFQVRASVYARKQTFVVYLKASEEIMLILSAIGAHGAILEIENVRITKDARNRANRATNCDNGNISKILSAADRQLQAIRKIERTIGLDALPDTLREIAIERMRHADVSLEVLGSMLEPPVGKSGVHHRLARLEAIAQSIDDINKEESL